MPTPQGALGNRRYAPGEILASTGYLPPLVRIATVLAIALPIFLTRFQLNVGSYFLNVGLVAQYAFVFVLILHGFARIDPIRCILFAACLFILMFGWIVNPDVSSATSVLLVFAIHLVFVFVARPPDGSDALARFTLVTFGNIMLICAVAGILQFFLQFVVKAPWLIDYTPYIPDMFRGQGTYTTTNFTGLFFKSNGFFFRESARFSQYLAVALLSELAFQKKMRPVRMAILGLALLVSYSGTGLLTLVVALMFPISQRTFVRMVMFGLGGLVIFVLLGGVLDLSFTVSRIHEFSARSSSAYARFVGPFIFVYHYIDSTPFSALVGHGPGSITRLHSSFTSDFAVADVTWSKLVFEYGLLGFVAFTALFYYSLVRSRLPQELIAALFLGWIIVWGGIITEPDTVSLIYIFGATFGRYSQDKRRATAPRRAQPKIQHG